MTEGVRRNTSREEQQMREIIAMWARTRWGDVRIIHELALGDRRADLVVVGDRDLAAIEIKSSSDRLDRLPEQLKEYNRYIPEVWAAVAPKHKDNRALMYVRNLMVVDVKAAPADQITVWRLAHGNRAARDELVYSRMLELLWQVEAARIAQRTDVIPGVSLSGAPAHKITAMLARLLTGNEILRETCAELRARPLVGMGSDGATR